MQATVRRTTIADVAKAAGVSKTAVSFAFNSPERLSTETVGHIHEIAADLGYRPDPVARSLAQRRTGTIGILTPQSLELTFNNPYHSTFAAGVGVEAERAGYALQFISPLHGSLARAVDRASVDGIIAVGLSSTIRRSCASGARACAWSSWTRPRPTSSRASRSTTKAAHGRPPSTSSTSAIGTSSS